MTTSDLRVASTAHQDFLRRLPDWASFGMVYRGPNDQSPMAGNASDSGAVLAAAYDALFGIEQTVDPRWVKCEADTARERVKEACRSLGIVALTAPRPDHGTGSIFGAGDHQRANFVNLAHCRSTADAVIFTPSIANEAFGTYAVGSLVAPADCVVVNLVFAEKSGGRKGTRGIAQIHAGWDGLEKDVIAVTMQKAQAQGLDPRRALAYLAPHAGPSYTVYGAVAERFVRRTEFAEHMQLVEGLPGRYTLNMGAIATQQLVACGVDPSGIIMDPTDTLIDPRFPSHRNRVGKMPHIAPSRFGVILGMRAS